MKQRTLTFWLIIAFSLLVCILVMGLVAIFKVHTVAASPVHVRTFVKEKTTGLVTVMDSQGKIICTFYDSVGGIGHDCPDTVSIYPVK